MVTLSRRSNSNHRTSKKAFPSRIRQKGQALLILLLVLAVSLTVVLSSASRSITDIQTTGLEEDSLRAFNAAEVGIEEALIQQAQPSDEVLDNGANYTVNYTIESPDSNQFVHPAKFFSGDTGTLWLVSQDSNGNLVCGSEPCLRGNTFRVCWGNSGAAPPNNQRPAIEVSVFYDTSRQSVANPNNFSSVKVARRVFDPYSARANTNNFLTGPGNISNNCQIGSGATAKQFLYRTADITYQSLGIPNSCHNSATRGCLLMIRVKFLYNDTTDHALGFIVQTTGGPNSLPPQGAEIESTGVAGDSTRRINVYQSYPEIPSFFDSAVFSRGSLTK